MNIIKFASPRFTGNFEDNSADEKSSRAREYTLSIIRKRLSRNPGRNDEESRTDKRRVSVIVRCAQAVTSL